MFNMFFSMEFWCVDVFLNSRCFFAYFRGPTWQVYIDDPDVANAAKENISVSFDASVGGNFFLPSKRSSRLRFLVQLIFCLDDIVRHMCVLCKVHICLSGSRVLI